ncbi:MAG: ribosome maturation factor RimP [Bacteroidota bacterium]
MLEIKRKIETVVAPVLQLHNAFVVDLQVRNERGGKFIQLFVDTDEGITIEQCAEISRSLSRELETRRLFDGEVQLEISSPGIDRPLRLLRQYHKNIGRRFKVTYTDEMETNNIVAKLVSITEDQVTLQPDRGGALTLPFHKIIETKEELPW